jgi:hypothetical protein
VATDILNHCLRSVRSFGRTNFGAFLPCVFMDVNTLISVLIGLMNAGLSFGMSLGLVVIFLRKPGSSKSGEGIIKCHLCNRSWKETR